MPPALPAPFCLQEQLGLQFTPKSNGIREGNREKRQRLLQGAQQGSFPAPGSPSAWRELQQQCGNGKCHISPRNATGISPDQHKPPAPPLWKLRAHNVTPQVLLKLRRPGSQLELFLGTERADNFRAISVPHWVQRCWGWLCRCAQQRQLLGDGTTEGSCLAVTLPTGQGTVPAGSLVATTPLRCDTKQGPALALALGQ